MNEEELAKENSVLRGKLENATRYIRDLEHKGLHALVVRELKRGRNVDIREEDGTVMLSVGRNLHVDHPSLRGAVAAAWEEKWDG